MSVHTDPKKLTGAEVISPLPLLDRFLESREQKASPLAPPAQKNETEPARKPFEFTSHEEMERQRNDNYIRTPNHFIVKDRKDVYGDDEDPNSDENQRKRSIALSRTFNNSNMGLSVDAVVDYLTSSLNIETSFMKMNDAYIEVKPDQMLHVKNGQRIDPKEDPEGKYLVRTAEEKKAYEDKMGACSIYKSQDEVTVKDGKLVDIKAFNESLSLQEGIANKQDLIAKVESGEVKVENLDQDLKNEIKAAQSAPKAPEAPAMSAQDLFDSLDATPKAVAPAQKPPVFAVAAPQPGAF